MLSFLKENKILAIGVLILLAGVVYFAMTSSGGSPTTLTSTTDSSTSPVSQNLLVTLSSLRTITLNDTIFTNPVFVSLTDFGVTIPQQPIGRRNPFASATLGAAAPAAAQNTPVIKLPAGR